MRSRGTDRRVLALSFHLLCRASEIKAFGNGLVHSDFCPTRWDLVFLAGASRLADDDGRVADREVTFRASKSDNKRLRAIVTRTSVTVGNEKARNEKGYLRGAGNYSGPSGLLPRVERVSTAHADPHGKKVEGHHAHGSDKGLEADGKQSGQVRCSTRYTQVELVEPRS